MRLLLDIKGINISYDGKTVISFANGKIYEGDKIALLGRNGAGKSSLLKAIVGKVRLKKGKIDRRCKISYVPQLNVKLYKKQTSVFEYLSTSIENWWDVLIAYRQIFREELSEERIIATLSGGELEKLLLAKAITEEHQLLILDEPTNHLDIKSLISLQSYLHLTKSAVLFVSHNMSFLTAIANRVWEIDSTKISICGGNYEFYLQEKKRKLRALLQTKTDLGKEIKKEKLTLKKESIKSARSQEKLEKNIRENRRIAPKILLKYYKDKGQKVEGSKVLRTRTKLDEIEDKVSKLEIPKNRKLFVNLESEEQKGLLVSIKNGELSIANRILLKDVKFAIHKGERVAILGANGTGKTTFVKKLEFAGRKNKMNRSSVRAETKTTMDSSTVMLKGTINYGKPYTVAYIDQKYSIVNPKLTVEENLAEIEQELRMKILADMGFMPNNFTELASELSGGETARLAFAKVSALKIDLLILDEPTNNLDIETVESIIHSINLFKGGIISISHDINFLSEINTKKAYLIKDQRLLPLTYAPTDGKLFEVEVKETI